MLKRIAIIVFLSGISNPGVTSTDLENWVAYTGYRVLPDITYHRADTWEGKIDLYLPRDADKPVPTLVYIHGGGWNGGAKERSILALLPYIEMGWAVVNVEYRLAEVALAPAAVEDCRCALRWVYNNAEEYQFDLDRIVVSGSSTGGHLALTTGLLRREDGLDYQCSIKPLNPAEAQALNVAAIINYFGITDVADLLEGDNAKRYAVEWIGSPEKPDAVAKRVSPIRYVRKDSPPTLTIHGDADPIVPYAHATQLHKALEKSGVENRLITVQSGGHGNFSKEQYQSIANTIREFVRKHVL